MDEESGLKIWNRSGVEKSSEIIQQSMDELLKRIMGRTEQRDEEREEAGANKAGLRAVVGLGMII